MAENMPLELQHAVSNAKRVLRRFDLPVVFAQRGADFWAESMQEYWEWDEDFFCIKAPFQESLFAWTWPDRFWCEGTGWGRHPLSGTPMICHVVGAPLGTIWTVLDPKSQRRLFQVGLKHDRQGKPHDNKKPPVQAAIYEWAEERGLVEEMEANGFAFVTLEQHAYYAKAALSYVAGGLLSVCFMHCKNVAVTEADAHRKVRRAGYDGYAMQRYHVLDIRALRKAVNQVAGEPTSGSKALHICRGHFANYTAEKPLFGKYTGRYWVPAHVRGDEKAGTVVKDYRV